MMRRLWSVFAVFAGLVMLSAPAAAGLSIRIDLSSQRMQVTTPDGESFNWAISSGRMGHRTPNGVYRPQRLERHWHSRRYDAPMPHSIFFRGGYAIHATNEVGKLGRPASRGCIRLSPGNAARLFQLVRQHGMGATRIAINGVAPGTDSMFAESRPRPKPKAMAAKPSNRAIARAKPARGGADWATARGRVLQTDPMFEPAGALGFQPVRSRAPTHWILR
jgi:hypothetical protein